MKTLNAALIFRFIDRLSAPARSAARSIGTIEQAQRMASRASAQWSRGMDELDGKLDRLAKFSLVTEGLNRAGQSIARPLMSATQNAASFERGMTGIGITAQMTDRQLVPLRENIMDTATELGALPAAIQATYSAVLAEGAYRTEQDLARAGRAVSRFQKLASTMNDPLSDSEAGGLTAALGGTMGVRAADLDRNLAMASRSAQQGGVGIGVLGRNMPSQIGALSGLSFANDVGLADLLTANQIAKRLAGSSDQAANNVTNLFAAMASPETIKNFSEAGVNIEREIKRGVAAGISPLETLATVTQRITGGDQFRIGELFGDRQARDAVMALTQNLSDFRRMSGELKGDDVLTAYLADLARASTGTAANFDRYTASMSRASVATGSILAPAAGLAAAFVERIANWMSAAAESGNPLARAAVYVAAGLAAAAVAAGAVGTAVMGILGPWFIMQSMFGTLGGAAMLGSMARVAGTIGKIRTAVLGLNVAMLANPVVLIAAAVVAAIALVAGAAYLIYRNWGVIGPWLAGVWSGVKGLVSSAIAAVTGFLMRWTVIGPIARNWSAIVGFIRATMRLAGEVVGLGLDYLKLAILRFTPAGFILRNWVPITRIVGAVWQGAKRLVEGGLAAAGSAIMRFSPLGFIIRNWGPITTFIGQLWNTARTIVTTGLSAIGTAITSWSPLQAFIGAFASTFSWFQALPARFMSMGGNIVNGMTAGIRGHRAQVQAAAASAAGGTATAAARALDIRSPSRVFARLGAFAMQGLSQGLERSGALPLARVVAAAAALAAVPFALSAPATAQAIAITPIKTGSAGVTPRGPAEDDEPPARPGEPGSSSAPAGGGLAAGGANSRPTEIVLIGAGRPPEDDAPPPRPPAPPAAPMSLRQTVNQYFTVQGTNLSVREIARELKRIGDAGARAALDDGGER